jgi:hypothetical protein
MKQKLKLSPSGQKVSDFALWLIISVFAMFLMLGSANATTLEDNANKTPKIGSNKNITKYHRKNKRAHHCSACPTKFFTKLIPRRSWRLR